MQAKAFGSRAGGGGPVPTLLPLVRDGPLGPHFTTIYSHCRYGPDHLVSHFPVHKKLEAKVGG